MNFWFLLVILGIATFSTAVRHQAVGIKGKLLCGSAAARNVRVKLWDEDSGPQPDDLLAQGYTDEQGIFTLAGDTFELTSIDPVLKVYHDCNDNLKLGLRKLKFKIPTSYINEGKTVKKMFDIGVLNLETIFPDEEREMIPS
ncbi:unnamed protein product [Cercopithifilaria johnstoni]|uniref:Transthyretin-like family protein n=1 Tax=Cercopithifilaria johnstoni TaxID=2874296 RepID=A0A8J2Q0W1_9BILA|nr:unnamed protein product [Cercopithifilaria johnstoni]